MDIEEIKQLFKHEGDGELKPIPTDIYDQFKEHLEKSRKKAEIAKDMDTDFYTDLLSNINRDEGEIRRFVELRMRKVGDIAIYNACHTEHKRLVNATKEEMRFYDEIYSAMKERKII